MASIPSGDIPVGTANNWWTVSRNGESRELVFSGSVANHPATMNVSRKIFKKTAARPFDILQVQVRMTSPFAATNTDLGYVQDVATVVINLALTDGSATLQTRLRASLQHCLAYLAGGFTDAELTSVATLMGDNIADQLSIGLL